MKKIFTLAIFLFTITSYSEETTEQIIQNLPTKLYMPNESGQFFVLTEENCNIEQFRQDFPFKAWSTDEQMVDHLACWNISQPDPRGIMDQMVSMKFEEIGNGAIFSFRKSKFSPERKRWDQ